MKDRRDFIKLASILGIAPSSGWANFVDQTSNGKVLVVGAGPAGMTVAHLLAQRGVEYEVLEAAETYGGRTKTDKEFVDEHVVVSEIVEREIKGAQIYIEDKPVVIEVDEQYPLELFTARKVMSIVLGNLIRNAVLYTNEGSVRVSICEYFTHCI